MLTDYTLQIALGQISSYVLTAYALQLYLVRSVIIDMLASFGSFIILSTLCAIFTLAFPPSVSLLRLSLLSGVFLLSLHLVPAFGDFCFQFPPSGSLQSAQLNHPIRSLLFSYNCIWVGNVNFLRR
ncbi:unnamed protein product [Coffea canephora]|uniref:Uncharacterized protein n=1 Tax=Coffea canephora TaxID=49390 RepID=A0A068TT75_COFCA|nr:unnamed protein product [Coffea canephora]